MTASLRPGRPDLYQIRAGLVPGARKPSKTCTRKPPFRRPPEGAFSWLNLYQTCTSTSLFFPGTSFVQVFTLFGVYFESLIKQKNGLFDLKSRFSCLLGNLFSWCAQQVRQLGKWRTSTNFVQVGSAAILWGAAKRPPDCPDAKTQESRHVRKAKIAAAGRH